MWWRLHGGSLDNHQFGEYILPQHIAYELQDNRPILAERVLSQRRVRSPNNRKARAR